MADSVVIERWGSEPILEVEAGDLELVVCRVKGEPYALEAYCSHAGAYLGIGTVHEDSYELECPLHGGAFDVRTGEPTRLPCNTEIRTYRAEIEGDSVRVDLEGHQ